MARPTYAERFGFCPRQIHSAPSENLGITIVIPCSDEPDLIGSLDSLWSCTRPKCDVEIIVVINSGVTAKDEVRMRNQATLQDAIKWHEAHRDSTFRFHFIDFNPMPSKHAGVGLARKIGMDEAAARFNDLERSFRGIILCYDADCRCDDNYLTSVEEHFASHPDTPGCSIFFEHPLEGPLPEPVYAAVEQYELHLRYYVQALRYAGFPYAHHTVGSAMAVRAEVYQEQGGMNRRQAGEDFYFLQKIIPAGTFTDLTTTRVIPSPRPSHRVPFGTGRAVQQSLEGKYPTTYALEAFLDLKFLFDGAAQLRTHPLLLGSDFEHQLSPVLREFLNANSFSKALEEMRSNSKSTETFQRRFYAWFNGFQIMKYLHYARDQAYGARLVEKEAAALLELIEIAHPETTRASAIGRLQRFRQLDRACFGLRRLSAGP